MEGSFGTGMPKREAVSIPALSPLADKLLKFCRTETVQKGGRRVINEGGTA